MHALLMPQDHMYLNTTLRDTHVKAPLNILTYKVHMIDGLMGKCIPVISGVFRVAMAEGNFFYLVFHF